jgi:hypothetical protein
VQASIGGVLQPKHALLPCRGAGLTIQSSVCAASAVGYSAPDPGPHGCPAASRSCAAVGIRQLLSRCPVGAKSIQELLQAVLVAVSGKVNEPPTPRA